MKLYHSTSDHAGRCIDAAGFRDAPFLGVAWGVCLSDRPLSAADGVARSCDVCFEVTPPAATSLDKFEIIEEGRPEEAYREWLVPASVLNGWHRSRYVEPDDEG